MTNTSIPAIAEGMSEIHVEKRISELATEISRLMDRAEEPATLMIFQASTGLKPRYQENVPVGGPSAYSALVEGIDKLDEARAFADLLNLALDSLSGDISIRTEVNALQYGMREMGKSLQTAKGELENAQALTKPMKC